MSVRVLFTRALTGIYGFFIRTPPFLDEDKWFPGGRVLEQHWQEIAGEARAVLEDVRAVPKFHELLESQMTISANDDSSWHIFVLRAYGQDQEGNMNRCPVTARLLRSMPEISSATFSILEGRKHIPAHHGPYRGILRYQLGLVIPTDESGEPQAILRVEDQKYRWREGEGVLWDDTYEHEVWNMSDGWRIVFLLDVRRPNMPFALNMLDKLIYEIVKRSSGLRDFIKKSEVPARELNPDQTGA